MYTAPKCPVVPGQQAVHSKQTRDLRRGRDELVDTGTARQPAQAAIEETDQDQAQPENRNRAANQ